MAPAKVQQLELGVHVTGMQLVPRIGLARLAALRERERFFRLVWGIARWLTLALVLLVLSTFIDWRIDRARETPHWLRIGLSLLQGGALLGAAWIWVIRPFVVGPSLIKLARRVEEGIPEFGHRLVTSIQLTDTSADTRGMSSELIESLTRESETISEKHHFTRFADSKKFYKALKLSAIPVALLGLMLLFYGQSLLSILVQRQLFASVDIPRSHMLENKTPELWPSGDEVQIEYLVTGRVRESDVGRVRLETTDGAFEEYPLEFLETVDDNQSRFGVEIPPSSENFRFRAWLRDGRTKEPSQIRFEPRPVVIRTDAWVQLLPFLSARPDGKPYEALQAQGEVSGLEGSTARIRIVTQKPIVRARLLLLSQDKRGSGEFVKETREMAIEAPFEVSGGEKQYPAEGTFTIASNLVAYRVDVIDHNGFHNLIPPRRGIKIIPDEPPLVRLLPERYGEAGMKVSDEDIIEGLPIPLGGQIPIAYTARSIQGLKSAQLRYRINESGPWHVLPLKVIDASEKSGPFDMARGTFAKADEFQQVEFHIVPSPDRDTTPDYLTGGGHFDFQTAELTKVDEEGNSSKLAIGDRVEYFVEVFDRNPAPGRPPGRSESRVKEILSASDVLLRLDQTRQAESKIRDLEKKQRDLFGKQR
jgi:hypothetical protein